MLDVTRQVEQALHELTPALQQEKIDLWPDLFRPANFVSTSIHNIRTSLLLGALLVIVVLFLFLFDIRTAAVSCTAIPLSLLAAVAVMDRMGFSVNTMTLGGLAIAIGEVVDDAVIDIENILRRLRENAAFRPCRKNLCAFGHRLHPLNPRVAGSRAYRHTGPVDARAGKASAP
jgi:Cu/Ag efflux pump CusA